MIVDLSDDLLLEIFKKLDDAVAVLNLRKVSRRFRRLVDLAPLVDKNYTMLSKYVVTYSKERLDVIDAKKKKINIFKNLNLSTCMVFDSSYFRPGDFQKTITKIYPHNSFYMNDIYKPSIMQIRLQEYHQILNYSLDKIINLEQFPNLISFQFCGNELIINHDLKIKEIYLSVDKLVINCDQTFIKTIININSEIFKNIHRFKSLKSVTVNNINPKKINELPKLEYLKIHKFHKNFNDQEVISYNANHLEVNYFNIDLTKCNNVRKLVIINSGIKTIFSMMQNIVELYIIGRYHQLEAIIILDLPCLETFVIDKLMDTNSSAVNVTSMQLILTSVPKLKTLKVNGSGLEDKLTIITIPKSVSKLELINVKVNKIPCRHLRLLYIENSLFINEDNTVSSQPEIDINSIQKLILRNIKFSICGINLKQIICIEPGVILHIPKVIYDTNSEELNTMFRIIEIKEDHVLICPLNKFKTRRFNGIEFVVKPGLAYR